MRPLTSLHAIRACSPLEFLSASANDFCNTIGDEAYTRDIAALVDNDLAGLTEEDNSRRVSVLWPIAAIV